MQILHTHQNSLEFRVPNGSVGIGYNQTLKVDGIVIDKIYGLESISGLSLNPSTNILEGVPQIDGDFSLRVKTSQSPKEAYLHITINPNPKSLWQDIAPDKNAIFFKPNSYCTHIETPDKMRLLSASQRGRSHAHSGKFRDDDSHIAYSDSGWSILAVADGAGSCELSRRGSQIAVNSSIKALEKLLDSHTIDESDELLVAKLETTIIKAVHTALQDIEKESKAIDRDIKEFSTTLLLTAHKKRKNSHLIITFWVGDGALALYQKDSVTILGSPDSSQYAGETKFLDYKSIENSQKRVTISIVDEFEALILLTDGVSDPMFKTAHELYNIDIWHRFFEYEGLRDIITDKNIEIASKGLLAWLDFWQVGSHDDRSVAVLMPIN